MIHLEQSLCVRNRTKQMAAAIGGGIALLLIIFGLNSLFSGKPKLKMIRQPEQIADSTASPALEAPPADKPAVVAASPGSGPEATSAQTGNQSKMNEAKPAAETTAPLAVPVAKTQKSAAPAQSKAEKPAAKPEKHVHKAGAHPTETKSAASRQLVATLDNEMPARKKADALTKQGHHAIVIKVKKGNKTVYQVWQTAPAATPAKAAAATPKAKAADKSSSANHK